MIMISPPEEVFTGKTQLHAFLLRLCKTLRGDSSKEGKISNASSTLNKKSSSGRPKTLIVRLGGLGNELEEEEVRGQNTPIPDSRVHPHTKDPRGHS